MYRFFAAITLAAALLFAAGKPLDEAKALLKDKKFEEAVAVLDPAIKANPKDAALKTTMVDALLGSADGYMYNDKLPPFKKYPAALKTYRRVLEFDKNNQKAKDNITTIEGIYKSMGRPVPQ